MPAKRIVPGAEVWAVDLLAEVRATGSDVGAEAAKRLNRRSKQLNNLLTAAARPLQYKAALERIVEHFDSQEYENRGTDAILADMARQGLRDENESILVRYDS